MSLLLPLLMGSWLISAPLACTPPPKPAAPITLPAPPLFVGPPQAYIPAAGLRWLLLIDVRLLAEDPRLLQILQPLLPEERILRFGQASGFNLQKIQHLAIAGFDYSTLYLVETSGDNSAAEQRFSERLRHAPITTRPHPRLTTTTGIAAGLPQRMVRIHDHLVAIAVGDPTPARVVEAYARRRLKKSPSVFDGAAFKTLPPSLQQSSLLFFAPGPFERDWAVAASGLLEGTLAVGANADLRRASDVELSLWMSGDFDSDPTAPDRLVQAWQELAESSLGRLLGLHEPLKPPRASARAESLRLDVTLKLAPIVAGLYAAVGAEAWQLLNMTPEPATH